MDGAMIHGGIGGRRSSIGVPLSTLIFPRSASDRNESNKLARAMEEKYGFHFFTNTFCRNPLVELDYLAYYTETNIVPACYAGLMCWCIWALLAIQDIVNLMSGDDDIRRVATLHLLLSIVVFVPVPVLIACCKLDRCRGYEQIFLCAIVHCFAIAIIADGAISCVPAYRSYLLKDMERMLDYMAFDPYSADHDKSYSLDGDTVWWDYEDFEGTGRSIIVRYLEFGE